MPKNITKALSLLQQACQDSPEQCQKDVRLRSTIARLQNQQN